MELLALAISLVSLAANGFLFYLLRKPRIVNVELVYEILPLEQQETTVDTEDGSRAPVQESSAADTAAWKNRTGIPFTDFGPPPPPIAPSTTPPLSRPGGFV